MQALHRAGELLDDAPRVARAGRRPPVADAVHPQHPVVAREDLHRVHLRQRIAVPVVGEADDVAPLELSTTHRHVPPCPHLGRARLLRARAPPHLVLPQPQLQYPQRVQLFLAIAHAVLVILEKPAQRLLAEPLAAEAVGGSGFLAAFAAGRAAAGAVACGTSSRPAR